MKKLRVLGSLTANSS